jgi:hypothetical protein
MRFVQIILILVFSTQLLAQNVAELNNRNGFKDLKMNSSVLDYKGLEFKKDIVDNLYPEAKLYVPIKGYYESIGSLKIYDLQVKTYRDSIFQIIVVTDGDIYKGLKAAFGEPEFHYRAKYHYWMAENLRLSYISPKKNKLELRYESFLMREKLKKDKREVVEAIVDDF